MPEHLSHHPEVQLTPVKSSNIEKIGYHEASNTMHVVFKDGGHYVYNKVKPALFQMFMKAPSKGSFFHKHIKAKHESTRLN